jgi:predicted GNAT family acetyltransferase
MTARVSVTVQDNRGKHRFEAVDESGTVAGFAQYLRREDHIVFTHTEVDEAFEGQGVGSTLARGALDAARSEGLPVIAQCPFIKDFIERHPDYQDLLA